MARFTRAALAGVALLATAAVNPAAPPAAAAESAWIPTWAASPQPVWGPDFFAPLGMPRSLLNQTVRQFARVSLGGTQVRVVISNEYGDRPLVVGAAHVALAQGSALIPTSDRPLTFGGQPGVTIPAGAPALSDPVDVAVPPLGTLAVSLFLPGVAPTTTWHNDGVQTALISRDGDFTGAAEFPPAATTKARLFLSEILVDSPPEGRAIVLFGDSITDGNSSTPDANRRWPDFLAERLAHAGQKVAVVNQGISGDRILRDRMGDSALGRFERDVLAQPRADTVVLMMGINDIGWPGTILVPPGEPAPSAEEIIAGYRQLIARAHAHGMRIIGATLTPFHDALAGTPIHGYFDDAKEAKRQAVNAFIRQPGQFDGVIDFDAAVRDPADPVRIRADYDSGDHLHPGDAGYKAMADAVDLSLLGVKP